MSSASSAVCSSAVCSSANSHTRLIPRIFVGEMRKFSREIILRMRQKGK
jgi:hypothetical protein